MTKSDTVSTDGFRLGETVRYRNYSASGKPGRVVVLTVIEVRTFPTGRSGAVGADGRGRTQWLYAAQRAA